MNTCKHTCFVIFKSVKREFPEKMILLVTFLIGIINALNVGTWNAYDIANAAERQLRREYTLNHVSDVFDEDVLCVQEAFSPNAVKEFNDAFSDVYNYSYYVTNRNFSSIPCDDNLYFHMTNNTGLLYTCFRKCNNHMLSDITSWIFCVYEECFVELKDTDGVTNKELNPELYELGQQLELKECWGCLWQYPYIHNIQNDWNNQNFTGLLVCGYLGKIYYEYMLIYTEEAALMDLLDTCHSDLGNVNYRSNPGVMLFSKYELIKTRFIRLASVMFVPRGILVARIKDMDMVIGCLHLEPALTDLTGTPMITFNDRLNSKGAKSYNDILKFDVDGVIDFVTKNDDLNLIITGDFNTGVGMSREQYDRLLVATDLENVFGSLGPLEPDLCTKCGENDYNNYPSFVDVTIDHILIKGDLASNNPQIYVNTKYNVTANIGTYLSDHNGVKANIFISDDDAQESTKNGSVIMTIIISSVVGIIIIIMCIVISYYFTKRNGNNVNTYPSLQYSTVNQTDVSTTEASDAVL